MLPIDVPSKPMCCSIGKIFFSMRLNKLNSLERPCHENLISCFDRPRFPGLFMLQKSSSVLALGVYRVNTA